jgi:hypothetical protein
VALELYEGLKNANDGHGVRLEHFFTRSNRDLTLVRKILKEKCNVETYYEEMLKPQDFKELLNYFNIRAQDGLGWSVSRLKEQWHGEICAALRLIPPLMWQYWLSEQNPWSLDKGIMEEFINSEAPPGGDKNYYGEDVLPVSFSLGDRFAAAGALPAGRGMGCLSGGHVARSLLVSILKVEKQECENLKTILHAELDLTGGQAPVILCNSNRQNCHGDSTDMNIPRMFKKLL